MSFFRLAAIGDGLIGPLVHSTRDATGNDRSFVDNRFLNWLRVILPNAELAEDAVFGVPGETTVAVAKRVPAVLDLDPAPDAVLICAGTEDCLATIKGVAPTAEQTIEALEVLATTLCAGRHHADLRCPAAVCAVLKWTVCRSLCRDSGDIAQDACSATNGSGSSTRPSR